MPIACMQRYAELARGGGDTIAERVALLKEHDRAIQEQVAHLRAQRQHIREKIRWYRSVSPRA